MRNKTRWLGATLIAGLSLVGLAVAESGGKGDAARGAGGKAGCADKGKGLVGLGGDKFGRGFGDKAGPGKDEKGGKAGKGGDRDGKGGGFPGKGPGSPGGFGPRGFGAEDVIERLLALDKNKDGKVTKEELPERMQDLLTKGDTNKDGALDKEEIKKLAADAPRDGGFRGFGPFGGGAPGGFGGFRPGGPERALDDLKLSDKKREQAEAAMKVHQENVRKLTELARADLLLKMKDVLSEEEFKTFKESLDRGPGFGPGGFGPGGPRPGGREGPSSNPPPGAPRPGDLEKKVDQLQKELEELRRQLKR